MTIDAYRLKENFTKMGRKTLAELCDIAAQYDNTEVLSMLQNTYEEMEKSSTAAREARARLTNYRNA